MLTLMNQIRVETNLRWNRVSSFKPKHKFLFEMGSYQVKTADSIDELKQCFKLRNEIFNIELQDVDHIIDVDRFDRIFDHLIIIDKKTNTIVGTYRMRTFDTIRNSYTALEFDLTTLTNQPWNYLELGRACIHKDHRKGAVISLLWRGIAEYMKFSEANSLFGCSSVKIDNARDSALVYQYLYEQGSVIQGPGFNALGRFKMTDFHKWTKYFEMNMTDEYRAEAEKILPSLLKSYLKLGAKVVGEPAYDEDFSCVDFLTILNRDSLDSSLARKLKI